MTSDLTLLMSNMTSSIQAVLRFPRAAQSSCTKDLPTQHLPVPGFPISPLTSPYFSFRYYIYGGGGVQAPNPMVLGEAQTHKMVSGLKHLQSKYRRRWGVCKCAKQMAPGRPKVLLR
ncbi:unnamed protein product [Lepidochelys kempii]